MKYLRYIFTSAVLFSALFIAEAQTDAQKGLDAISESAVKGQLEFLASDWTEGRGVGTKGAYLAADYIASVFKIYGIEPFGDTEYIVPSRKERMEGKMVTTEKTFFQNFSLLEYSPGEDQFLSVIATGNNNESAVDFNFKTDFYVTPGTVGRSGKAGLVFAGYGFKNEKENYDDLNKLELKGKVAVILAGFPGHKDSASVAFEKFAPVGRYAQYGLERNKIENLSKAGAVAVIRVDTENDLSISWAENRIYPVKGDYFEADEPFPTYYDNRMTLPGDSLSSDLPVFTVSKRLAGELISGTSISFEKFEENAKDKMKPASSEIPGKQMAFKTTVDSRIVKARNVLGMIEGEKQDEFIVVGAHYDHVGKYNGWIWNGADDNASGTVGVMTIAKAFKATGKKPEKTIIFAAWTGEEKGLWGSRYFVREAVKENMDIVLNLNYDMIARDAHDDIHKNKAMMTYTKANAGIEKLTKKHIQDFDINLDLSYRASELPAGGSDHAPFAQEDIPIFYFMAAMHPDYHLPSDELSKINWAKMINIIKLGFLNTWEFATSDEYLKPQD
ncbi:M20/M25/M40 family metallo-hydrolase [Mariniphaga sp.]|uniref:M20/M25/M40 family metallo-hydrolase n=1 Tax=Mariniphaga sp. TaxID=1954475 RepID=UPI00356471D5